MLAIERAADVLFLKDAVAAALVVPSAVDGNVMVAGVRVVGITPVPVRVMI